MPRDSQPSKAADDWWWVFDPRISLRARTALVIGGGSLLLVLLVSGIAASLMRRHLQEQFAVPFEALALQISDRLDRQFYERYAALQRTAAEAALRTPAATPGEIRRVLESTLRADSDLAWLGFADLTGNVVASTQKIFEGTNVAETAWFRVGREKPYAARVHAIPELARIELETAEPARFLDFAVPVTTPEGRLLGVLGAHVRMPLNRDIVPTAAAEVARRAHLGVTVYGAAGELLLDTGASGWTEPPVAPDVRDVRGSLVETTGLGTTYFSGYVRARGYRDFPGLGWLVLVRQPVRDAFAPAARLQREIVGWGAACVIALTALSWWFVGRLVKRMAVVEHAANLVREGDILTVMPHPTGDGEMDRMCAAVDNLVEDLRAKAAKPVEPPPASERHPW